MNILTDILSLIRRGKFAKTASKDDVLVLGMWNEEPEMTGVASPIPYKSVKLIKVKDFKVAAEHCAHANSPATPPTGTGQIYQKTVADETTEECTVYYRSIKSLSSNLTIGTSTDDNYVEIDTDGEPNTAANLGNGIGVWENKVGETLNFKSLVAGSNINLSENNGEITITSAAPYTEYRVLLTQAGTNAPTQTVLVNTAGITITWTYQGVGQYTATFSSPISNVASINIAQVFKSSPYHAQISGVTTNGLQLFVAETGTGFAANSVLLNTELLIKQY